MNFTISKNVAIGSDRAYLVMITRFESAKLITVVHKNEFQNKLGGTRFVTSGSIEEAFHLAKGMSEKCLACHVPVDGLKTLVITTRGIPSEEERANLLSNHIKNCIDHEPGLIFGPDMGSPESVMVKTAMKLNDSAYQNITGLSKEFGGLDIDKNGFTAHGAFATVNELQVLNKNISVSLQGYGEVGSVLATLLYKNGCKLVAISNVKGVLLDPEGIDVSKLQTYYSLNPEQCLLNYATVHRGDFKEDPNLLFEQKAGLLIPAARTSILSLESETEGLRSENPDVLSIEQVLGQTELKYIVEVANHPLSYGAERYAEERGVMVVPDFIVNCGGMIGCYIEWKYRYDLIAGMKDYEQAIADCKSQITEKIRTNLKVMFKEGKSDLRRKADELIRLNKKQLLQD